MGDSVLEFLAKILINNIRGIDYAFRIGGEAYRDLYQRVDKALYQAKESGRNCLMKADNSWE